MSSTRGSEPSFELFAREPVYLVAAAGDTPARVIAVGEDPAAPGRLGFVTFDVGIEGGYAASVRVTLTERLLEIRPRPRFLLGRRDDETDDESASRFRAEYIEIDQVAEAEIHAWLKSVNRGR